MEFTSGPRRARPLFSRALAAPIVAAQISVCACDLAPKYEPPQYVLPADYQGSKPFKLAQPLDTMQRAPWWERFGDPLLDQLERQLTAENPDLAAFAEQYTQARDLAAEARSGLFPQLTASGLVSDNKESQYRLFHNPHSTFQTEEASNVIQATASWEPDFWSQIRNKTRAQKQLAQASAATLAAARLSLQAELANDYIALRGLRRPDGDLSRIDRELREGGPDHQGAVAGQHRLGPRCCTLQKSVGLDAGAAERRSWQPCRSAARDRRPDRHQSEQLLDP